MKYYLTILLIASCHLFGLSQCYMDRHSTSWYDNWASCTPKVSPNPSRGLSHWVLYDLGYNYTIKDAHFWNYNDPGHLNFGAKTLIFDISDDGVEWIQHKVLQVELASGLPIYEGVKLGSLGIDKARYLLVTVAENYGGKCFGYAEIKFDVDYISATYQDDEKLPCMALEVLPNLFSEQAKLVVQSNCHVPLRLRIESILGQTIFEEQLLADMPYERSLNRKNFNPGVYVASITDGRDLHSIRFVVIGQ